MRPDTVAPVRMPKLLGVAMLAAGAGLCSATAALADIDVSPSVSIQAIATDNLRRQASDPESDAVLQTVGSVQVSADTLRLKLLGTASLLYDAFAESSELNRLTGNGLANAQLTVVPGFMFLDGSAQVSDEFLDVLDQSPTGLPNGAAQSRVSNLQAGVYVTTTAADMADIKLRAGVATVQSDALDSSPTPLSLSDTVSYSGGAVVTSGARSRNLVWTLAANIVQEEREDVVSFRSADATASVKIRVTPRVHVVAQGGYEDISGAGLTAIKDELWAAGINYEIGNESVFELDWGHRYGRESWSGTLDLKLSDKFVLGAEYSERIESQQGRLGRQLSDLFDQSNSLPTPQLPSAATPGQSLVDDVFYSKDALLSIAYTGLSESFSLTGRFSERDFSNLPLGDSTIGVTATYSEVLIKDLVLGLSGTYDTVVDSPLGVSDGDRTVGSGSLTYRLGERASASFQYTWSRTEAGDSVTENIASAGITHSF